MEPESHRSEADFSRGDSARIIDKEMMTANDVNERSGNTNAETTYVFEKGRIA